MSFMNTVKVFAQKYAPEILTGAACIGVGVTSVLASRATLEAHDIVEHNAIYKTKFKEKDTEGKKEQIKHFTRYILPAYVPSIIAGSVTIACMVSAHNIETKRLGAVASICAASTNALESYKNTVTESVGEKKAAEIAQNAVQKKVSESALPESTDIPIVEEGASSLWYDETTDRYFYCTMEKMRRIEADLKNQLLDDDIVRLNDIYDAIGLEKVSLGDDLGFDIKRGDQVVFDYNTAMSPNDEPMCTVNFPVTPLWSFPRI